MTPERLHELFELDAEAGILRWKPGQARVALGQIAGTTRGSGYVIVMIDRRAYLAHRIVFAMTHGFFPLVVDHINGIKSDNRPCNLRAAGYPQNQWNRGLQRNNTSGAKGVYWETARKAWHVRCRDGTKNVYVGRFKTLELAKEAAREFRKKHHKEFARHE